MRGRFHGIHEVVFKITPNRGHEVGTSGGEGSMLGILGGSQIGDSVPK